MFYRYSCHTPVDARVNICVHRAEGPVRTDAAEKIKILI